ncbi:MAG: carotenoid 1,2-hydratase [Burkholderiales bacterium]|nr:carotenoid 1,2-hydratase [Burkholderiales bacterium]
MLLAALPAFAMSRTQAAETAENAFASVNPGYRITFPRDHGSHPEYRIEWWYVTGWLRGAGQPDCGFQVTFFRARPRPPDGNPSRFNPGHVIIAHAAIADGRRGSLVHVQRAARQGFGLAGSETGDTRVWLGQWQLVRDGALYRSAIAAPDMGLNLVMAQEQPPLLQGVRGYSRKGPRAGSASHYYSIPHLRVSGEMRAGGTTRPVTGQAWLDHEWSSSYLDPDAAGWDWAGINLIDGGAIMAFRIRDRRGGTLWAGGSWRDATGKTRDFSPGEVRLQPLRRWRSPRTGAEYPVAFTVTAGALEFHLDPLMDDQENDTRATTGAVYWEGAMRAHHQGREIGRGYLELTGYLQPLEI